MTRLLVVDDVPLFRAGLTSALRDAGFDVIEAVNGVEAVQLATTKPFNLLLLDIEMPEKDGFTALDEIRSHGTKVPVMIVTSHASMSDDAFAKGIDGFLEKPLSPKQLVSAVTDMLCVQPGDTEQ